MGKGVVMCVWLLVNGCVCTRVSKRERERDTRRDRQTGRQQTERNRLTDRETNRDKHTHRDRETDRQTDKQTDRQTETQRHRDRDRDRQTDRTLVHLVCSSLLSSNRRSLVSGDITISFESPNSVSQLLQPSLGPCAVERGAVSTGQ